MTRTCKWRSFSAYLVLVLVLFTGCTSSYGGAVYEIIYPSGYIRDPYVRADTSPVEGTTYQLRSQKSPNYEETHQFDLQILNENNEVLYEYPQIGSSTMRGEAGSEKNTIGVCSEFWNTPHYNGYVNGYLNKSYLMLLNMQNGDILFQEEIEANHLYLTTIDGYSYFYFPGKVAQKGLFKYSPTQNAEIYYVNTSEWTKKNTLYTFDYVSEPEIKNNSSTEVRARFKLDANQLEVVWMSYELDGQQWVYKEQKKYDISIESSSRS